MISETVAKGIQVTHGPDAAETVNFIDKFFDCFNVSSYQNERCSRRPFQEAYRLANDFKLKWLQQEFLPYLNDWEKSVMAWK